MGKKRPKNVEKIIADAQARQVENALVAWLKKVIARDQAARDARAGDGTRRRHRR